MDGSKSNKNKNTSPSAVHASITVQPLPPEPKTAIVIEAKVVPNNTPDTPENDSDERMHNPVTDNLQSDAILEHDSKDQNEEKTFDQEDNSAQNEELSEADNSQVESRSRDSFRDKLIAKPEADENSSQTIENKKVWKQLVFIVLALSMSIFTLIFLSDFIDINNGGYINTQSTQYFNIFNSSYRQ